MSNAVPSLHELPTSRFNNVQANVRSLLRGSSNYSNTPRTSPSTTPKLPTLAFLRRDNSPSDPEHAGADSSPAPQNRNASNERLHERVQEIQTAYPAISVTGTGPEPIPEAIPDRHPADRLEVPDRHPANWLEMPDRHPADRLDNISVAAQSRDSASIQERIRRKTRLRHQRAWIRKRRHRNGAQSVWNTEAARNRLVCILISGVFLATVLTVYLSIALTRHDVSQEVHVLFILIILIDTVFFCHSLIRLCMLALHGPEPERPRIPSYAGPHGFRPNVPIVVHLARDDEIEPLDEDGNPRPLTDEERKELDQVKMPPPAYGLWRSSVRVDPNLLHWQRVNESGDSSRGASPAPGSRRPSQSDSPVATPPRSHSPPTTRRPPSYASDDGVSYVVEAQPRSTVVSMLGPPEPSPAALRPMSGMSQVHPAYRS